MPFSIARIWFSFATRRLLPGLLPGCDSDDVVVNVLGRRVGVERLAPRQPDLAVAVDLDALDDHLVALRQHVLDRADPLLRDLGDVEQAIGAGDDLDERPDLDDLLHDAVI